MAEREIKRRLSKAFTVRLVNPFVRCGDTFWIVTEHGSRADYRAGGTSTW
jgi:hypothetical protein